MIGVLSGFGQQIAIPNIFGTRREALTTPCRGRGGSLSGTQNCENNPMQSRADVIVFDLEVPFTPPALQAWCGSMASCWMRRTARRHAAS